MDKRFIEQIEVLCAHNASINNHMEITNTMQEAMSENGDTVLVDLVTEDPTSDSAGALNIAFYAYSENYIYFLEKVVIPFSDGEMQACITSIPRNPNPKDGVGHFGGYA